MKRREEEIYDLTDEPDPPVKIQKITKKSYLGDTYYLNNLDEQYPNLSTVKLEDIFDIENLKSIFISTYSMDMEFLIKLIAKKPIPITIVKHWVKGQDQQGKHVIKTTKNTVTICHPRLDSYGSVHSKLWLLEFDGFVRVVVTSGNFTMADWLIYIQTVWIQDFPSSLRKVDCEFRTVLGDFWKHTTCDLDASILDRYDFSKAKVHLVPSVPGRHKGQDMKKYGMARVKDLLKQYNYDGLNDVAGYQVSSLGKLNKNSVPEFCSQIGVKTTNFSIIFPTHETVAKSRYGYEGAGMSFLTKENYESQVFPRDNMHDFTVLDPNSMLAHSKLLYSFHLDSKKDLTGWIMTGSHNFSGAALGKLEINATQIYIYNYELSVFFPPKKWPNIEKITNLSIPYPIPFKIPATKYSRDTVPWYIAYLDELSQ